VAALSADNILSSGLAAAPLSAALTAEKASKKIVNIVKIINAFFEIF